MRRWRWRRFTGLVWQMKMASLAVAAMAPVGAVYTFIALVTGAAWGKPMWGTWWVWDARLTSELVLLFLYAGVIALWHAFDDRKMAGRAAGILVLVGVVNLPVIHYSVEWWNTLHQGSTQMQQSIDPAMRSPLRWGHRRLPAALYDAGADADAQPDFTDGKTPPVGERTDTEKGAPVSPAFSSWSDFFAMGGYAFFVWLAVAMTVAPLALLALHTVLQRRAILRGVAQQRAREARMRAAQAQQEAA
ncbi:heme exporter protein C [Salmonella enterica subsp. enterica]|nr:heme exporter protein C [Salmonella enterica subsp. enterica]